MAHHPLETFFSTVTVLIIMAVLLPFTLQRTICYNNGTLSINGKQRMCSCPHPFTGQYCEDYSCINGLSTGQQYDPGSLFFNKRCLCDAGWTGPLCSISIINRCGEHGSEMNGNCKCNRNFAGERCQYVTKCIHGQLYNGRCACHYGWSGDFCDQIVCQQGEADQSNKACICPAKYRGKYCDFCAEPSTSPPPHCTPIGERRMIPINGGNFLIFMLVIILVVFVVLVTLCMLNSHNISRSIKSLMTTPRRAKTDINVQSLKAAGENKPLNGP